MGTKNHSKIAKGLSAVWGISYILMGITSTLYTHSHAKLSDILSSYQIITTLIVLVFFYPMLWVIHHHAKLASEKRILIAAKILIGFLSYWLFCVFILWIKNT